MDTQEPKTPQSEASHEPTLDERRERIIASFEGEGRDELLASIKFLESLLQGANEVAKKKGFITEPESPIPLDNQVKPDEVAPSGTVTFSNESPARTEEPSATLPEPSGVGSMPPQSETKMEASTPQPESTEEKRNKAIMAVKGIVNGLLRETSNSDDKSFLQAIAQLIVTGSAEFGDTKERVERYVPLISQKLNALSPDVRRTITVGVKNGVDDRSRDIAITIGSPEKPVGAPIPTVTPSLDASPLEPDMAPQAEKPLSPADNPEPTAKEETSVVSEPMTKPLEIPSDKPASVKFGDKVSSVVLRFQVPNAPDVLVKPKEGGLFISDGSTFKTFTVHEITLGRADLNAPASDAKYDIDLRKVDKPNDISRSHIKLAWDPSTSTLDVSKGTGHFASLQTMP